MSNDLFVGFTNCSRFRKYGCGFWKCAYFCSDFERYSILDFVYGIQKSKKKSKKNSNVEESAYSAQNAQFGLVMLAWINFAPQAFLRNPANMTILVFLWNNEQFLLLIIYKKRGLKRRFQHGSSKVGFWKMEPMSRARNSRTWKDLCNIPKMRIKFAVHSTNLVSPLFSSVPPEPDFCRARTHGTNILSKTTSCMWIKVRLKTQGWFKMSEVAVQCGCK